MLNCNDCQIEIKTNKSCNDGLFRCKQCAHKRRSKKYGCSEKGQKNWEKFYTKNSKKLSQRAEKWNKENKEQRKITVKKYRSSEKYLAKRRERYWADVEWERIKAVAKLHGVIPDIIKGIVSKPCNLCGSTKDITIDHMHPVSRGGKSVPENLQPLCNTCNAFKNNRLFLPGGGIVYA